MPCLHSNWCYQSNWLAVACPVACMDMHMQILNSSGDEDRCYYNFECSHPFGVFTAFNNVWSNIGYFLLGFLFLFIVTIRWAWQWM